MGVLVKSNQPCHICGSSDARAIYDDHEYCFSCKDHTGVDRTLSEILQNKKNLPVITEEIPPLPFDLTQSLSSRALAWLKGYGITDQEIHTNNIQWSDSRQGIVFPIYGDNDDQKVIAWELRNIGRSQSPKTQFFGKKQDVIHIVNYKALFSESTLVIVEDIISAIKVGRAYPTLCLFGSSMNTLVLERLKKLIGGQSIPIHITLWLDQDKLGEAMKIGQQAKLQGYDVAIVQTVQDPKYHDIARIRAVINDVLAS